MNRIIKHGKSDKRFGYTQNRPITSKGAIKTYRWAQELKENYKVIIPSELARAIQTSEAIEVGYNKNIEILEPDERLNVVNFAEGHGVGNVGARQAFIDTIELFPETFAEKTQMYGSFFLNYLTEQGVLAVSHGVPIEQWNYALGLRSKDESDAVMLEGIDFGIVNARESKFHADYLGRTVIVKNKLLEDLASQKDVFTDEMRFKPEYIEMIK